jgi:hypothetical protein
MTGDDFTFSVGQCVRGSDDRVGVIEHLGRIWGRPAYFVRGTGWSRWYEQPDLALAETVTEPE